MRLRYAYFIKCEKVIKDPATGAITELQCTYDPATRGGNTPPDGRKVKATLHWVSAAQAMPAEVRIYEHLFTRPDPEGDKERDYKSFLNPQSLVVLKECRLEPALKGVKQGDFYQFERMGYFTVDADSSVASLIFNRSVTLRDELVKIEKKQAASVG